MSREQDEKRLKEIRKQPVKVHLTAGCELCGNTGKHTHPRAEWEKLIDSRGH